ncbi:hypothetical protein AB0K52_15250 [Glycomyces sp. NPDC049804]|uniref:hypothetical protein n=1 Tax=Glycomyces sp. NPDC049804 TaxID=3154363 RepID=UPI0034125D7F
MTPEKLLDALRALGYEVVYDPESHPDGPTEGDIPDLLGRLTAAIDAETTALVNPGDESIADFREGYIAALAGRVDFFRAMIVRTSVTSLMPDTEQMREVDGVTDFRDALQVAGGRLVATLSGEDL